MKTKKINLIVPLLLVGIFALGACQALPATNAQPIVNSPGSMRTIAVTGVGEIILVPDIAYINVGVHTEAEDVTSAVNDNNDQAQAIIAAIIDMGVEEKDIQTSNFNVYSMNRYDNMSNVVGVNFAVDNTLYIIVRDLPMLSEILDAALSAGANQVYGISFDINNRSDAIRQARDLAIQDAEARALSVAETAGVSLGKIQSISVINNSYVQPLAGYGTGGGASREDSTVPISAGQIVVTANADLVYEFGDK